MCTRNLVDPPADPGTPVDPSHSLLPRTGGPALAALLAGLALLGSGLLFTRPQSAA